jgi:primosomal protein N' (replication factor Y) (superfamily II helicase)
MIADVVFDAPVDHPFSYLVPAGWTLAAGQRVLAPLRGSSRVGVVVALRQGSGEGLKPLAGVLDGAPLLSVAALDLAQWIASESLTSLGSVSLSLLPPAAGSRKGKPSAAAAVTVSSEGPRPTAPSGARHAEAERPRLLVGPGRGARLLELIAQADRPTLILTGDVESAGRWAQRLERIGPVARLDSGVSDAERSTAWSALGARTARFAVGTRSALLAPLPAGSLLALLDEQDPAHRPPGHPRAHAREVILERAGREGLQTVLTAATPSVEMWWRAEQGEARLVPAPPAPWPPMTIADARGIARREALTPPLARALRETLAAGRRVFLVVSRLSSALGCDECGAILRCTECAIALAYSPAGRTLSCRLCGVSAALPETCPACHGRRLMPFGWGAERVEHAVRRRFARARIARYDPEAGAGRRRQDQRAAALAAEVVIGPRGALRLFGPASLGLAGFVSPDQMLGVPDFRAAERSFALLWAAAERVRPDGALIVQSQNPTHYALEAVARQDLGTFYAPELKFRAELGYPPVRRIAIITVAGPSAAAAERTAAAVAAALRRGPDLTVYPPTPDRRNRGRRIVVKGGPDLPRVLGEGLREFRGPRGTAGRGIIDVEVDPVEWPF